MPSDRKTAPAMSRIRTVARGAVVIGLKAQRTSRPRRWIIGTAATTDGSVAPNACLSCASMTRTTNGAQLGSSTDLHEGDHVRVRVARPGRHLDRLAELHVLE